MTMITGFAVALLTLIVPLDVLLDLVNIGTLIAFTVVCAGVIYLALQAAGHSAPVPLAVRSALPDTRNRPRDVPRRLRAHDADLGRFVVSLLVGLVIYFAYGYRQSRPEELTWSAAEGYDL